MYSDIRAISHDLWKDDRGWILLTIGTGWLLFSGLRFGYPALLPYLTESLNITPATGGLLLTVMMVAYALGQIPGGLMADRIGEGYILFLSTGTAAISIVVISLSNGVVLLFGGTILFGLSLAFHAPARFTLLSIIYPDRDGTAISITQASGNVGSSGLPVIASALATYVGWRAGFGFMIPLFLLVAAGMWFVLPKKPGGTASAVNTIDLDTFRYIFSNLSGKSVLIVFIIQVLVSFVYNGFVGFYVYYLVTEKGISPTVGAALLGIFFGIGIFIKLLSGVLNDILGSKQTLLIVTSGMVITLYSLPFIQGLWGLVILTAFLSILNGYSPVTQTYLVNSFPSDIQGTGFGILRSSYAIISSFGPLLVGFFGDVGLFDEAFFILGGLAGVAFLFSFHIKPIK